ncbi:MAG: tyrosine-type recombinase/integrase [Rhizomicrobium sp.]
MPRLALTDRFVAGAKATDLPQVDYFDAGTPGLALRVSEGGKKAWTYLFTSPRGGKRARLTLGTYPAVSLARARTLALEAKGHVDDRRDPRDVFAAKDASALTVALLCESYLEKHARPNLRSAANFEQRLRKNVIPVIGSVRLADLHPRDINEVLDPIIRRKAPTEANRVFENLRAMFNWAAKRGDLDRSPVEKMAKPAPESGARKRSLSDDEIRHLWHILPDALAQSKACQRIVKLCLITGQRVGEIAGMRADELNLKNKLWSLPGSRVKNGTAHSVPLSRPAIDTIEEALADAGDSAVFVFPSPAAGDASDDPDEKTKAIDPHAIATALRRAHKTTKEKPRGRFGMAPWRAHDLRRTVLTGLAQLGVQPIVIASVANHLSVTKASVTFVSYVQHDYAEEKAKALKLWAECLAAIIEGRAAKVVPLRKRKAVEL